MLPKFIFTAIILGPSSAEYGRILFHSAYHTYVMICLTTQLKLSFQVLLRYYHVPAIILSPGGIKHYCNYTGRNELETKTG